MTRFRQAAALALAAATLCWPGPSMAGCSTADAGARCVSVPARGEGTLSGASAPTPAVKVGDVLDRGAYSILLNADYYGLPPVSDGWVYMRVERDLFRVDWQSQQVLERVTDQAAANF
jgi:hypothetical protein